MGATCSVTKGVSLKKTTIVGAGLAAGLVAMSLVSTASFAAATDAEKDCGGVQRLVCSADVGERFDVTQVGENGGEGEIDQVGTLRWAIAQANDHPGLDEVVIAPHLEINVADALEIEPGLILRGEGSVADRSTITAVGGDDDYLFYIDGTPVEALPVQFDNLVLDGAGGQNQGVFVGAGVSAFGVYGSRVSGFAQTGFDISPDIDLETVIVSASEFTDLQEGNGAVHLSLEDSTTAIEIRDSSFTNNRMVGVRVTGALGGDQDAYSTMRVRASQFIGNIAEDDQAGAIIVEGISYEAEAGLPARLPEPIVLLEGNLFENNSGDYAGALCMSWIDGDTETGVPIEDFGAFVVIDRSSFVNNVGTGGGSLPANDIAILDAYPEVDYDVEAPHDLISALHVLNTTFTSEASTDPAVYMSGAEAIGFEFDHVTFKGTGIAQGELHDTGLYLRNTAFDTGDAQPITQPVGPGLPPQNSVIAEDHVAYTTVPSEVTVAEGAGRIVASSAALALGALSTVDVNHQGLAYTTKAHVPGAIAGADPAAPSVLIGAGKVSREVRLAFDQLGVPRATDAPSRAVLTSDIGAVQGIFDEDTEPETPGGEDPDPSVPPKPKPTPTAPTPQPAPSDLAQTGATSTPEAPANWLLLGGILVGAGAALAAATRLNKSK